MKLSQKLVRDYRETHKRKYGQDISLKEAERRLNDLKELLRAILSQRRKRHGK
jgi:hypothetical protein